MRVLVTGGGGFIGSHVVEALLAAGHGVRVVDRDPTWTLEGVELVRADLAAPGVAEAVVRDIDAVSHQASRVGLGRDFTDAPGYVEDNQLATARLLAALAAWGFRGRLVLASSMVVYGEGRYRCRRHGEVRPGPRRVEDLGAGRFDPVCPCCGATLRWQTVDETAPLEPRSLYAAAKVGQEQLCSLWARETGATAALLRYHNVYGPRLPLASPYAGVAGLWSTALRRGRAPRVFEDGAQMRDFIAVGDVAAANLAGLAVDILPGGAPAWNICSGRPVSIREVADLMCDAFGPAAPRPVVTGEYRLGDVRHVVASARRAAEELGFRAQVPLRQGLAEVPS